MAHSINISKKHPCLLCKTKNHCCIDQTEDEGMVLVDFRDIRRIEDFTGFPPSKFAHFKKLSDERLEELNDEEKYYFLDGHVLLLKKNNLRCIFLNKQDQCKIHPARPNLCRLFPFWYEEDEGGNLKIIRHNTRKDDVCHITNKAPRISQKVFEHIGIPKEKLLKAAKESDEGLEEYQKYKKYLLVESIEEVMNRIKNPNRSKLRSMRPKLNNQKLKHCIQD